MQTATYWEERELHHTWYYYRIDYRTWASRIPLNCVSHIWSEERDHFKALKLCMWILALWESHLSSYMRPTCSLIHIPNSTFLRESGSSLFSLFNSTLLIVPVEVTKAFALSPMPSQSQLWNSFSSVTLRFLCAQDLLCENSLKCGMLTPTHREFNPQGLGWNTGKCIFNNYFR